MIQNPSNLPEPSEIDHIEEPIVKADIMIPKDYVGTYYGDLPGTAGENASYGIHHGKPGAASL